LSFPRFVYTPVDCRSSSHSLQATLTSNCPTSNTQQAFLVMQLRAPHKARNCWPQNTNPRTKPYRVVLIGGSPGVHR
ncbi:hypothetical protein BV22DRAFT_1036809, partial [Leucogyrophana mollusca]